jgi:uncharacterized membrane protein YjdF
MTSQRKHSPPHLAIGILFTLVFVTISRFAVIQNYRFVAPAILTIVLWALYGLREKLNLNPFRYAFVASAMLLHMLGAFGYYQRTPLPFSYDILVHFYFATALTTALYFAVGKWYPTLTRWQLRIITFFVMMGLAALHEIMEYLTYLVLGEERGMLKPGSSYFFDTQRDLTNNLLGTLTVLIVLFLINRNAISSRRDEGM